MKLKKIVIIDVQYLHVAKTGLKTYIHLLVEALNGSENFNFLVYPSIKSIEKSRLFNSNMPGANLIFHLHTLIWKQFMIPFLAWKNNAYAIIFPAYHAPIWKLNCKKIIIFHDTFFWENPEHYNKLWLKYFKWSVFKGLKGDTRIVSVSHATKKSLSAILKSEVHVVYQSTPIISKSDAATIPIDHLEKEKYFLHVGVMEKRKNLTTLIRGFHLLQKEYPDVKLVLVGQKGPKPDMDDFELIKSTIQELGLDKKVILPGFILHQNLNWLYQNALAYVFPSFSEGFGIPVLEAFSHGLPLIISKNEALVEIARDGAISADANDFEQWYGAMKKLVKSENLREELIANGKLRLQTFTETQFRNGIEKLLED
jgi:glycosyltransferase involved in cell wall biosynthesis